jgi:hypothetical protein
MKKESNNLFNDKDEKSSQNNLIEKVSEKMKIQS